MKLKNKKTGEIMQLSVKCENGGELRTFDLNTNTDKPITLAELNAEWEDYEEPKGYWRIDEFGTLTEITHTRENIYDTQRKNFGNYFETREEAEKAVEKLKALKRLKDKGFKFDGWDENHHNLGIIEFSFPIVWESVSDFEKDLDLLFGGEE